MTPEQLAELKDSLKETVQQTVNGKINNLSAKLDNYIQEDTEWKDTIMPTINQTKKIMDFASVGSVILKAVVLIGASVSVFWAAIKFIKK